MPDLIAELEDAARRRFVRWDPVFWKSLVEGPARELAGSLEAAGSSAAEARPLVESYLRLGCEAIGLGYLFPPSAGESFLTQAWLRLIPRSLAALPAARRAESLATCWNLGENLESSPIWLRRIVQRRCAHLERLDQLESVVAAAGRVLEPPAKRLGLPFAVRWVHLGPEDPRFLPGAAHFLAPTVACVHERRTAKDTREWASLGVWLDDPPLILGALGCRDEIHDARPLPKALGLELKRVDPRAVDTYSSTANEWRGIASLKISQFVVALLPA